MQTEQAGDSGAMNLNDLHKAAMNMVEAFCSILCRFVELILRPWHGSRYFDVPVVALATLFMILMPLVSATFTGLVSMIPFSHPSHPVGLIGIGTITKLYFMLSFIHAIRIYWRMIDMSREKHSEFAGPALPFFAVIPGGGSFWVTRIALEPAFVFIVATVLGRMLILQPGVTIYLQIAALALAMKNFIGWYKAWEFLRTQMDLRFAAPIIAKLGEGRATEDELAAVHLASFPKNLDPDIRSAAVSHIARSYSPNN